VSMVTKIINNFLLMMQFLTRININKNLECRKENFRWGSIFMPLIGLIIGGLQWGLYKALIYFLPVNVSVLFSILLGIILTGAMHIDGLGDMCDGFFAFKGNDRIIEIMKDSRVGTYSCIAIVMDILLKYSLLCYIVPKFSLAIVVSQVISRFSTLFIIASGNTAKSTGTGNLFIDSVEISQFLVGAVITFVVLFFVTSIDPIDSVILMLIAIVISFGFNMYCKSKIGGLTGDLLGANNEIMEIAMLAFMYIFLIK
jgi:adenosylcobinamide-GDP ribazoletransferase